MYATGDHTNAKHLAQQQIYFNCVDCMCKGMTVYFNTENILSYIFTWSVFWKKLLEHKIIWDQNCSRDHFKHFFSQVPVS